jgi:preprotein translocase SecE subunit
MAVAVLPEEKTQLRELTLPQATLAGTLVTVLGAWLIYFGLYEAWDKYVAPSMGEKIVYNGLRVTLMVAAALVLIVWGLRSMPKLPGLRAGIFLGVVSIVGGFFLLVLASAIINSLCVWLGLVRPPAPGQEAVNYAPYVGIPLLGLIAFLLLRWLWRNLHTDKGQKVLVQLDDQGWFRRGTYKRGQGLRVRRLTMLGILLVVGSGIYVYGWKHNYQPGEVWAINLPFGLADNYEMVLLRSPGLTLSVLTVIFTLWFVYRLVNYPRFGDFLIATEAEMNKVSWANTKHLKRDTIVVLVTTVLLTLFLWSMDILWSWLLVLLGVIRISQQ